MVMVHAFIGCFLLVIFIGSVPRRGEYIKTMFAVVDIDGNIQTLPIVFGLAVEYNLYRCTWFLKRLREALRQGRELSFIANMDEHVFLDSYLGDTSKSVFKYMSIRDVSDRTLQLLLSMTSNSYIVSDFEENFRRLTPDAHEMFANIGNAKWARAYFPNIRWNLFNIDVLHFLC
uniref:MULE transposase domain-containing protein n=1 Tax=Lactuca sativa TaxID=4236 RepID=A0A9R1VS00_LACSA|nr:hypothetical protein LSAT_V11C400197430 [Lactuca sativa]